jgi:hypothetical protein
MRCGQQASGLLLPDFGAAVMQSRHGTAEGITTLPGDVFRPQSLSGMNSIIRTRP